MLCRKFIASKKTAPSLLVSSTLVSTTTPLVFSSSRFCASAAPKGTAEMSTPESSEKIKEMAKLYSQMTLKEISTLQRQIFKELGHSDDFYEQALLRGLGGGGGGGGTMMAAMPVAAAAPAAEKEEAPAAAAPAAPKAAEKTAFDVSVASYPAESKIKLVKELRTVVPALSIKEAKDAIDKCPGIIAKSLGKDDAEKLKAVMEKLGAKVELQ